MPMSVINLHSSVTLKLPWNFALVRSDANSWKKEKGSTEVAELVAT